MSLPTLDDKIAFLRSYGWTVGERNSRINTDYPGAFMCAEPFEADELPTRDGSNGPWCIVGDDLPALVDEAHSFLRDFTNTDYMVQIVPSLRRGAGR